MGAIFFEPSMMPWYEHLIGLAVATATFMAVYFGAQAIYKKEALGGGDVKLAMAMGLFVGWKNFLFSVMVASIVASIVLLLLQKVSCHHLTKMI